MARPAGRIDPPAPPLSLPSPLGLRLGREEVQAALAWAAASIEAMSSFLILRKASLTRLALAGSEGLSSFGRSFGITCHERPKRSLHQPQTLSSPPPCTKAFQ